jgi:hypothetical protein
MVRGATVVMMPKPKDHLKALMGIGRGLYGEDYLRKERESWDNELHRFLVHHKRIAIDTNIFVYMVASIPRYRDLTEAVFAWVKQPGNGAIASTIVVTELLVPL